MAVKARALAAAADHADIGGIRARQRRRGNMEIQGMVMRDHKEGGLRGRRGHCLLRQRHRARIDVGVQFGQKLRPGVDHGDVEGQRLQREGDGAAGMAGTEDKNRYGAAACRRLRPADAVQHPRIQAFE